MANAKIACSLKLFLVSIVLALVSAGCSEKSNTVSGKVSGAQVAKKPQVAEPTRAQMEAKKDLQKDNLAAISSNIGGQRVDFSSLEGREISDLYKVMSGLDGVVQSHTVKVKGKRGKVTTKTAVFVPKLAVVNYGQTLKSMWIGKLDRKKGVSDATIDNSHTPLAVYSEDPKTMNLKQFIAAAQSEVNVVNKSLNWAGVCKSYKLGRDECAVFKSIGMDIRGIDLVAYGMTELMPSADGQLNVNFVDILLRHAGSNYLMAIPAMYDKYLSLGLYQFTSLALRDDDEGAKGASRVNRFLPGYNRIPGSVIKLRNGQNHRAAYLFALHNFANMVQKTSSKEFVVLRSIVTNRTRQGDLVTYMACAHHAPGLALRSMKVWLGKGANGSIQSSLLGRLSGASGYGYKTYRNLFALEQYAAKH